MRLALVNSDMIHANTGLLNLQYFACKKGSYWSPYHTDCLKQLLCIYGAYHSKICIYSVMKKHKFPRKESDMEYAVSKETLSEV